MPNPHDKPQNGPDKAVKTAIDISARFTVTAIDNGMFAAGTKPEEIADFFLAITKRIIDAPIDGD